MPSSRERHIKGIIGRGHDLRLKLTEFESTCDVFNCLFPLDVQNEIQLLSRVFSYSWLVCLLGFWSRNASLVKAVNPISDGIVFVFHLAGCVRDLIYRFSQG